MQPIPAQVLTPNEVFKIDLQQINQTNNPVKGAVLQNLSGFILTITTGGDSWVLPAGTNDYISLTPITGGLLTVSVSSVNASPSLPNPILTGTLYETNDPTPVGYPMVNPGFLQAPPPGNSIVAPSSTQTLVSGNNNLLVPGSNPLSAFFPVSGLNYVLISDAFNTLTTGVVLTVTFYQDASLSHPIGRVTTWTRGNINTTATHWSYIAVQGTYMVITASTVGNNTITFSITGYTSTPTRRELLPCEQVMSPGVNGVVVGAGAQSQVVPFEYLGPGKFRASFAYGATGSAFPTLAITDKVLNAALPAGGVALLAAPPAGFQYRIKHALAEASTTAVLATALIGVQTTATGMQICGTFQQAGGTVAMGDSEFTTTEGITGHNSTATAGTAHLVYNIEPIPFVVRLGTASGNGNPQLAGEWVISQDNTDFEFIAPDDDWFFYITNESASSLTVSPSVIGPL